VVWQSAIGTGIHVADERGDGVFKIALVEIIEGSLLAPLDVFVAWYVSYKGTIHFKLSPKYGLKNADRLKGWL
jgi:hypothetical protein